MSSLKRFGIILAFIAIGFLCVNLNNINNERKRWELSRDIPEARQEFIDAVGQIPFEDDRLLAERFLELHIIGEPPDCIWGSITQIFSSVNEYNTTLQRLVERFENLGWISTTNPEFTPYYLINYKSPNGYMSSAVYPLSELDVRQFTPRFDLFEIDSLDDLVEQDHVYVINHTYHSPDAEVCVF